MKVKSLASLILLSSLVLTGCFSKTYEEGVKALKEGRPEEAKEIWVKLVESKQDDDAMFALYKLGDTNPEIMSLDESLGYLHMAADAERTDAEYEWGLFLINQGKFDEGYRYFDKAAVWKEERALRYLDKYHEVREFQIGAEKEDPKSMYEYSKWLLNQKDPSQQQEGYNLARKVAFTDYAPGQALYGTLLYEKGDYQNALSWFEKGMLQGNPECEYYIGMMRIQGNGILRNPAQGVENLKKAADNDNHLAQFELGKIYLNGEPSAGIEKNFNLAFHYISKAAGANMLEAQYIQATMYDQGLGVPKDNVKAITLYKLAAEHDHIKAQSKLGEIYVKTGNSPDVREEGIEWLKKAIEEHDSADAKNSLAYAYENGLGVKQDYGKAYQWYKEAADVDVAAAQFNIGVMVANGRGETKDMSKAFYWVEQAAYNDYPLAVVAISVMYSKGIGVDKDNSKATFWKNKADSLGITDFNEKKAKVSELLNLK